MALATPASGAGIELLVPTVPRPTNESGFEDLVNAACRIVHLAADILKNVLCISGERPGRVANHQSALFT